jgi:hypothetical protein
LAGHLSKGRFHISLALMQQVEELFGFRSRIRPHDGMHGRFSFQLAPAFDSELIVSARSMQRLVDERSTKISD